MDISINDLDSVIQLSKDVETPGFDLQAGKSWIYPTNYPIRDYQLNISQAALFNNTLVSLPTGLGKTFIAAVVMYNFYRWYPLGKIIFMAPTRPLVKQQMDACYNIMPIPPNATVELTGSKHVSSRTNIWKDKRVFFITPHILQNDLDALLDLAPQIRCLVIDEAHRALGKNANCEAIKKIHKLNSYFRVLALSATPGNNFNNIRDVIMNLYISHLEVRTIESPDVTPFVFHRSLETVLIPIKGKLLLIKSQYIKILDTYTRPLLKCNIISGNCVNLTKGRFVYLMKEFKDRGRQHPQYAFLLRNLNICISLYHGYELLLRHGLRGFLVFFEGNINKPLIKPINELNTIIEDIRSYLGPFQEIQMYPDGSIPEVKGDLVFSHPKFHKLSEILLDHFKNVQNKDTRIMVFCEYRESVMEIYSILLRQRPVVKPRIFVGQGSITQNGQIQTVKMFKSGDCNTLISTCIGEEGLDVGEVDLIICFDISSKSPIRMVQRMGRTGRKRDGRVVVLVTEGKEQQLLNECLLQKDNLNNILESQQIRNYLYANNPRLIPASVQPECSKIYMTVEQQQQNSKKIQTLKEIFENIRGELNHIKAKQDPVVKKPLKKDLKKKPQTKTLDLKQADIRSLFSKITNNLQSQQLPKVLSSQITSDINSKKNSVPLSQKTSLNINSEESSSVLSFNTVVEKYLRLFYPSVTSHKWKEKEINFDLITSDSLDFFLESMPSIFDELNCLNFFLLDSVTDMMDSETDSQTEHSASLNQQGVCANLSSDKSQESIPMTKDICSENLSMKETQIDGKPKLDSTDIQVNPDESSVLNSKTEDLEKNGLNKSPQKSDFNSVQIDLPALETDDILTSNWIMNISDNFILHDQSLMETQHSSGSQSLLTTATTSNLDSRSRSRSSTQRNISQKFNSIPQNEIKPNENLTEDDSSELCFDIFDESIWQDYKDSDSSLNIHSDDHQRNENLNADKEINLSLKTGQQLENKIFFSDFEKSVCNTTQCLSVTQMIEVLNRTADGSQEMEPNHMESNENKSKMNSENDITSNLSLKRNNEDPFKINDDTDSEPSLLKSCRKRRKFRHTKSLVQNENGITIENSVKKSHHPKLKVKTILKRKSPLADENHININESGELSQRSNGSSLVTSNSQKENYNSQNCQGNSYQKLNLHVHKNPSKRRSLRNRQSKIEAASKQKSTLSDTDDDFVAKSDWKPGKMNLMLYKNVNENRNKSKNKFQIAIPSEGPILKQSNRKESEFIDYEAEVERDEHFVADSDEDLEADDCLESSFIDDSQSVCDQTDMQKKYLQSIKSPKLLTGALKIPQLDKLSESFLFQVPTSQNDNYMQDSFCVANDAILSQNNDLSELEIAEAKLKQRKTKRRNIRRILEDISDDD